MAPPDTIPLRAGSYYEEEQLAALAADAIRREGERRPEGLTLTQVAAEMGKSVSSVSDAVNRPKGSMTALRCEIIGRYGGYDVDGPLYRLRKKE